MTRTRAVIGVCMLALVACTGEQPTPQTTGSPDEPPPITLDGRGVPLFEGSEGAARFVFDAADRSANVIVNAYRPEDRTLPVGRRRAPEGLRLSLCPITSLEAVAQPGPGCRNDIGLGVREPVSSRDFAGVAVVAQGAPGDVLADVVIQFAEASREVSIALTAIRGAAGGANCSDNGCNPFFELRPTHNGRLKAEATWDGPDATLVLLQGNVLGRSQTATGIPYREAAIRSGSDRLSIDSEMTAPGEYALALRHRALRSGEPALRNVRIDAVWP